MSWSEIENAYLDRLAAYEFPGTPPAEQEPAKGPEVTQPSAAPAEMRAIPRNETLGAVADFVGRVREMANQYEIKDWVPLLGGLGVGDLLVGKSPEEIENWAYGNLPVTMPPPGTGGYVPVMKTGRKQGVADTAMLGLDVAGPAVGVGKIAKNIATEIATTPPVGAINIDAFNPQQEIKTAVDLVAKNPETSIYVPQANRAPSVALSVTKPEIIGTGSKGIITVSDAGKFLEQTQVTFNGGKILDPTNSQDLTRMIDSASAEAEFQLSQPISGATWYEDDVATAFKLSSKIVPELATDEPLRVLTTAFAASTSYNTRAGANWGIATKISDHLIKTGTIAARNPENGKLWGGTTGPIMEQQLKLHEYMIKKMGLDGYASWLLTPHTVKEITQMKMESGLYKSATTPGKATDMKMGAFIMGEKGGAFFLNLNGIKETTADKWFTRTFNRHTGTLTSGPVSEQGLVDAPRNEAERSVMKSWNRAVAQNVNLDEQANQAVLWYFEQNLYYNLGVKSARSESFSDGAKNLLNARGIAIDEPTGAGAASGSNAGKARAKQAGPTAAGNPISSGSPAADANTTNVERGQAPAMGANTWISRDEFTAYQNQPGQLQGFKTVGPNKGFDEQKYKHAEFLEVKLDDGTTFYDAIRGLNKSHALSRAFGNWPAASEIRPLARLEAEKADPSLVKEVDAAMGVSKGKK
jgi:hypothetical protein